jgi:hypothetical protein
MPAICCVCPFRLFLFRCLLLPSSGCSGTGVPNEELISGGKHHTGILGGKHGAACASRNAEFRGAFPGLLYIVPSLPGFMIGTPDVIFLLGRHSYNLHRRSNLTYCMLVCQAFVRALFWDRLGHPQSPLNLLIIRSLVSLLLAFLCLIKTI